MNKTRVLPRYSQPISGVSELMHTHYSPFFPTLHQKQKKLRSKGSCKTTQFENLLSWKTHKIKVSKEESTPKYSTLEYSHSLFLLGFFDSLTVSEKLWSLANCFLSPWSRAACCNYFLGLPPPLFLTFLAFLVWCLLWDMETLYIHIFLLFLLYSRSI